MPNRPSQALRLDNPPPPRTRAEIVYGHNEVHLALENTRNQFAAAYSEPGSFSRTLALAVVNSVAANLMNSKLFRVEAMINQEPVRHPTLSPA